MLRLMAAANDARLALKQIIRAERGGRRPRNKTEVAVQRGERLYLERILVGHVEEAVSAFAALWNIPRTRRRLRRVMHLDHGGQGALDLLTRELNSTFRKDFLQAVRSRWAFHY